MPMTCSICRHPQRGEIDLALVSRRPLRDIARQYGVSKDALARHRHGHMPHLLAQAEALEATRGLSVRERVEELIGEAKRLLAKAEKKGQLAVAIKALAEARAAVGLLLDTELEQQIERLETKLRENLRA